MLEPDTKSQLLLQSTQPTQKLVNTECYPATSRVLHWVVALLVLVTWPLGFVIHLIKSEAAMTFYMLHEGFGFLVLWVMLLRVGNKLLVRSPIVEGHRLEQIAAHSVHGLLYVLLIVMPVSGFLATNAHGFPLHWFGLFKIWSPVGKAPDIAGFLSGIHFWSAWLLLGLFALHMGAVLMHHVIKRDHTLYKIL
nr:cytochrome b [uncultured Cohaesibacter sp.]